MTAPYDAWNRAIGQHFFTPQCAGQSVFLTVDEATLWQISLDDGPPLQFASQEQAVDDFVTSVRREICLCGWTLEKLPYDDYPHFLGFLALQVLAVFKMREDEKWTAEAYWGRLRELLHDNTPSMPLGLKGDQHQKLWRQGLERWANVIQKERWGVVRLPLAKQSGERHDHVGLPKSQALLTLADLYRLPAFYRAAKFRPGEALEVEAIQRDIEKFLDKAPLFRRHAQRVLRERIGIPKGIFALAPQEHALWSTPAPSADRFRYDLSGQPREEEGMVRKRCGRVSLTVVLPEAI